MTRLEQRGAVAFTGRAALGALRVAKMISRRTMFLAPAAAVFVCAAMVTIMTGGRNYQIGSIAGVAQIAGAMVGLYAMSWLVTGTFYLLSFSSMDRITRASTAITVIFVLSYFGYVGIMAKGA